MMRGSVVSALQACIMGLLMTYACLTGAQTLSTQSFADSAEGKYAVSLEQYNRYAHWTLRGVDGRGSAVFGVRSDERVQDLYLDLAFTRSSTLLEDLSHLNILLNGEVVGSLPIGKKDVQGRVKVALPTDQLRPYNYLQLQAISHYTMGCENPLHPDLWVEIDKRSSLVFDVQKVALPDDLGLLPVPFFDVRDVRPLELPFVMAQPTDIRIEAAGVVASWFGAMSGYRGARFTASADALPEAGNAVVILGPHDSLAGLDLAAPVGPTVAVRTNPNDSTGKLLIIAGRTDEEIRHAAVALAVGAQTLSGPVATLQRPEIQPRKPYDAPNWLPTDRLVALGELLPQREFTVAGFEPPPISIGLRLPPDLSDWRTDNVPLKLWYRHTAVGADHGTLDVSVNQQRVRLIELATSDETVRRAFDQDDSAANRTVFLPLAMLESQAGLQFQFHYPPPAQEECRGALVDTRRSAIDPRSTLDLRGVLHHKAMPDLAAFGTSGFPYTRMADLSETVVVLPASSGEPELSAFLTLLGRMGQVTGYPATEVDVQRQSPDVRDKDVLILEAGERSALMADWSQHVPTPSPLRTPVADSNPFAAWMSTLAAWVERFRHTPAGPVTVPAGGAYVAGFESPVSSRRSVVLLAAADGASLRNVVDLLAFDEQQRPRLQGSLATVRDGRIQTLSDSKGYYVGNLGPFQTVFWFLSSHPLLLFLLYLLAAVLIAIVMYLSLRARAQKRLRIGRSGSQ